MSNERDNAAVATCQPIFSAQCWSQQTLHDKNPKQAYFWMRKAVMKFPQDA
jgi:hypothetical protein